MVRAQSILKIVDNSGGKKAKCLKVKGKSGLSHANLGDVVVVSIQSVKPRYKSQVRVRVNRSEVHRGVVVQTRRFYRQSDGKRLSFGSNSVVLINSKGKSIGTRISTFLPRYLRHLKWSKIGVLARGLI
uniref:Ribosomal protein L14 n=1 Tax=Dictyopteris divaricata TaxID=156996 RepID=A0A4Y5T8R7_9PHAE|nr:ribosomal protein L14 [Dictyopteris divaricata]QDB64121.1 ribosomal protein L14 [Dictyopteris divaricata]